MENNIIEQVYAAKENNNAADTFIKQYMPFIQSETAKFLHRMPIQGEDDEISIAMFAFYETIMSYNKLKGSFLSLAALNIKNRLIDYYRKEKRHQGIISINQSNTDNADDDTTIEDTLTDGNNIENEQMRKATQREIAEFATQLKDFGLSLSDIADNCPKQDRTLKACYKALGYAKANPEIFDNLLKSYRLPIGALSKGSGVERKTLERHRKYMVAILLAYTNGYEIIRGHLWQVSTLHGGK